MSVLAAAGGLTLLDHLIVVIYIGGMVGVGYYFSGRQKTGEEYFVGSRGLPSFAVGLSIVATLLSTITYLAAPGDMIQHGLAFATQIVSLPFWLAIVVFLWVPFFMRYRLTSVYEYVEFRFDYPTRALAAVLFILMRFGWMGMIIFTAGTAIAEMTSNVPVDFQRWTGLEVTPSLWLYVVMITMGVIATAYTFLGGIRAVIWTDVVQFVVMTGGAVFAIFYVWIKTGSGPVSWWNDAAGLERAMPMLASSDMTVDRTVLTVALNGFFWRICTHCSDQVAVQRYFATRGTREALKSNVVSAIGDFTMTVLLGLVGLALLSFFSQSVDAAAAGNSAAGSLFGGHFDPSNAAHAGQAFPRFIVNFLPPGVSGLVMAALVAAAMSSVDSGVNSISAVVTTDFYHRFRGQQAGEEGEMWVARVTTVATGLTITAVAFLIALVIAADPTNRNIIDLSIKVFNLFLGPLAAIFMVGMFFPHVGGRAMIAATLGGVAASILLCFWKEIFAAWGFERGPAALWVTPLGTTGTVLLAVVLGILFAAPDRKRIAGHTWWTRDQIREPKST